jgi:rubrerythrin
MNAALQYVREQKDSKCEALALLFSTLSNACQKQKRPGLEKIFSAFSRSLEIQGINRKKNFARETNKDKELQVVLKYLQENLGEYYEKGMSTAKKSKERNVLRALTWGKKMTSIQNSLIKRFAAKGDSVLKDDQKVYICEACGFIILKEGVPDVCPVCKAPSSRFVSF